MSSSAPVEFSKAADHIIAAFTPAGAVPTAEEIVLVSAAVYAGTGTLLSPDDVVQRMAFVQKTGTPGREVSRKWIEQAAAQVSPITNSSGRAGAGAAGDSANAECSIDRLLEIVALCDSVEGADVFREPVCPRTIMEYNQSTLGPYSSTIRHPMSLSLIRTMITERKITTMAQLESRLWQIAANCVVFNAPEGTFPHLARQFASKCSQILREAKTKGL